MPKSDYSQLSTDKVMAMPGHYRVRIVKAAEPKNPDATGAQVVQITYEIMDGDDKSALGGHITDFVPFTGPRAWKFKNLTHSLNLARLDGDFEFIEGQEWVYENLLGRELEIDIEYAMKKLNDGKLVINPERRNVKNYMPYVRQSQIPADFESFASSLGT